MWAISTSRVRELFHNLRLSFTSDKKNKNKKDKKNNKHKNKNKYKKNFQRLEARIINVFFISFPVKNYSQHL